MKRICIICKKEFNASPYNIKKGWGRFCSRKCMGIWRSKFQKGKNNPSWKPKIKRICPICKKVFYVRPSVVKRGQGIYCSLKCTHIAQKKPKYPRVKRKCIVCGKIFEVKRSVLKYKNCGKFCSKNCHAIWHNINVMKSEETWIEREVEQILKQLNVKFEKQKPLENVSKVDFYLPNYKLIIYIDGNYWHSLPKVKIRDFLQNRTLLQKGYNILRLSEKTIQEKKHIKIIKTLIGNKQLNLIPELKKM